MAGYDFDIGVIGGGAAGLTICSGAAQLGAKTLLVEKEEALGGDCLHFGCVPSKTLIKSAKMYHDMGRGAEFGLPEVARPPVDFDQVRQRIAAVIATIQEHDSLDRFQGLGVQVKFGTPRFRDEHQLELAGQLITAKSWVIATGSSPAAPPFPGLDQTPHLTNREIFSLTELPTSLIVLGGGPIACEMAQAFGRLGSKVTILQRSEQILSKEDPDMAAIVQTAMAHEGITIELGTEVERVSGDGVGCQVEYLDQNGQRRQVTGEKLLVALGRSANTTGLGLAGIGVELSKKGIVVDSRLRSSQPHIFAAGDVTGRHQFTHAAGYEGGIVVSNAIFHLPRHTDYRWLPWATYCEPELASVGMNEKAAAKAGIACQVWTEPFSGNDRALCEGAGAGMIKMILDHKERPLGVQIAGPRAGDLIGQWVTALGGKVKLSRLASAIQPYPTLAEINKRVAGNFLSPKIFSPTIKKGLKFFFNYHGDLKDDTPDSQGEER
ncbi:MAG: FAD-dependent oxidoreductase [Thermodesulfobacteriota bacterium]